jgi:ketosteroid isomerase-like protein
MKYLILIFSLSATLASCVQQPTGQKNVELIDRYIQAVEDLDYASMETLLADDYVGLGPSYGDSIGKPAAIQNLKYNTENLYQDIDYERSRNMPVSIPDGPDQGEWVSNWAELTIVYKDGQEKVKIWANTIYKIHEGKIVKSITFYNEADVLEQLGYVFINPDDL